jgi:hypothetical protein
MFDTGHGLCIKKMSVNDLIDQKGKIWRRNTIKNIFGEEDSEFFFIYTAF